MLNLLIQIMLSRTLVHHRQIITPTTQTSTYYIAQVHVSYVVAVVIFHYLSSDGKQPGFVGASLGLALLVALGNNNCAVLGFDDGLAEGLALESSLDFDLAELLSPGLALWAGTVQSGLGKVIGGAVGSGFGADVGLIVGLGLGGDVGAELDLSSDLGSVET